MLSCSAEARSVPNGFSTMIRFQPGPSLNPALSSCSHSRPKKRGAVAK